jgi:hypothetical protein
MAHLKSNAYQELGDVDTFFAGTDVDFSRQDDDIGAIVYKDSSRIEIKSCMFIAYERCFHFSSSF